MKYNFNELSNSNPKIKYDMQKNIINISIENPKKLYGDFDKYVDLLSSGNNIMIWTGIIVLGNLSEIDVNNKVDEILPLIISKLNVGKMITAGNAVKSLIEIAKNKQDKADYIALEILKAENYKYDTEECSNILKGLIFASVPRIWDFITDKTKELYISSAQKEVNNRRSATSKKAQLFLKKYNSICIK